MPVSLFFNDEDFKNRLLELKTVFKNCNYLLKGVKVNDVIHLPEKALTFKTTKNHFSPFLTQSPICPVPLQEPELKTFSLFSDLENFCPYCLHNFTLIYYQRFNASMILDTSTSVALGDIMLSLESEKSWLDVLKTKFVYDVDSALDVLSTALKPTTVSKHTIMQESVDTHLPEWLSEATDKIFDLQNTSWEFLNNGYHEKFLQLLLNNSPKSSGLDLDFSKTYLIEANEFTAHLRGEFITGHKNLYALIDCFYLYKEDFYLDDLFILVPAQFIEVFYNELIFKEKFFCVEFNKNDFSEKELETALVLNNGNVRLENFMNCLNVAKDLER